MKRPRRSSSLAALVLAAGGFSGARSARAEDARPAGQPAWRMFNQCVLFFGKSVAVSGLMTASHVPLPSANNHMPRFRHQYAPSLPYAA